MNGLIPVQYNAAGIMPQLPAELLAAFQQEQQETFSGFDGGNFRRIKARLRDFVLQENGNATPVGGNELFGVCLGAAPFNHCVWYEREYATGQEPEQPDLMWVQRTQDYIPDALPQQFHKKIIRQGSERWAFQILRRTVWCLLRPTANGQAALDMDNPFVFDLSSMNLYGKSFPEQNMFKWNGLAALCKQFSNASFPVLPYFFVTQIVLDPNATVGSVVMFRPEREANGALRFLDGQTIMALREVRERPSTKDLFEIREKLDYKGNGNAVSAAAPVSPAPSVPVAPAPAPVAAFSQPAPVMPQPAPQVPVTPLTVGSHVTPLTVVQPVAPAQPTAPAQFPDGASLLAQAQSILAGGVPAAPAQPVPAQPVPAQPVPAQPAPVQNGMGAALNDLMASLGV